MRARWARSCREQMQQMKWRLFAYSITSSARFEQRRRNIEARRPSRLSVDDQLAPELEAQNIS
jgi:hypothetical protein